MYISSSVSHKSQGPFFSVYTALRRLFIKRMIVSVIIPAYNEEDYLGACLQSLHDHAPNAFLEIIVIDNASTDGTAEVARRFPRVRVVHEPKKGPTMARQRGLLEAKGTHLVYLDADTRITPEWGSLMQKTWKEYPELAALSGPYDYDDLPAWQRSWVNRYWKHLAVPAAKIRGYVIVGGNVIVRKDALEKIGGFDTSIAFYGDDTNLARRLHAVGKVRFDPKMTVFSSGRRIAEDGLLLTAWVYIINYLSESMMKKPVTKNYKDIR